MYRTGDLVRWRPDGQLEFLGRADQPGQDPRIPDRAGRDRVGSARRPDVRAAAVVVREDRPGERRLVGYASRGREPDSTRTDPRGPRRGSCPTTWCRRPFVVLDRLPLSPSGKLDRAALPAPECGQRCPAREPATPAEEALLGLVRELLGTDEISLDDDFFDVGGDSIVSLQLVSRARHSAARATPGTCSTAAHRRRASPRCARTRRRRRRTAPAGRRPADTGHAGPAATGARPRACPPTASASGCRWASPPGGDPGDLARRRSTAVLDPARRAAGAPPGPADGGDRWLRIPPAGTVTAAQVVTTCGCRTDRRRALRCPTPGCAPRKRVLDPRAGPLVRARVVGRRAPHRAGCSWSRITSSSTGCPCGCCWTTCSRAYEARPSEPAGSACPLCPGRTVASSPGPFASTRPPGTVARNFRSGTGLSPIPGNHSARFRSIRPATPPPPPSTTNAWLDPGGDPRAADHVAAGLPHHPGHPVLLTALVSAVSVWRGTAGRTCSSRLESHGRSPHSLIGPGRSTCPRRSAGSPPCTRRD